MLGRAVINHAHIEHYFPCIASMALNAVIRIQYLLCHTKPLITDQPLMN